MFIQECCVLFSPLPSYSIQAVFFTSIGERQWPLHQIAAPHVRVSLAPARVRAHAHAASRPNLAGVSHSTGSICA